MKPFSLELRTIESLLLQGTEGAYPDSLALPEVFWERLADSTGLWRSHPAADFFPVALGGRGIS